VASTAIKASANSMPPLRRVVASMITMVVATAQAPAEHDKPVPE
jgi:hypothetical protein